MSHRSFRSRHAKMNKSFLATNFLTVKTWINFMTPLVHIRLLNEPSFEELAVDGGAMVVSCYRL